MSDSAQPGWYHAEGDPPGTERYWDGFAWTEGPRPIGGTPSSEPPSDMPVTGTGSNMPVTGTGSDMPVTGTGSDMPVTGTGSDMPVTGASGLDAGFPSLDDAAPTPTAGSYGAGPSNIPGEAPGGFSTSTPPPSTPPAGFPAATPPPVGGAAFPSAPVGGHGMGFPEQSQATAALVFSSLGLFCCGFPAIIGIYLGVKEKNGMEAGLRDPSMKGQVTATFVIGGLALLGWFGLMALAGLGAVVGG